VVGVLTFSRIAKIFGLVVGRIAFLLIGLILTKRNKSFTNAQALTPFLILGTIVLFYL